MHHRVSDVLDRTAAMHGGRPAVRFKEGGEWRSWSWSEYRDRIHLTARGLIALGLGPGQRVVIIGYNRPEWFLADLGAIHAGGVPAGIYTTSSAEQCAWIASNCDAVIAVVQDRLQLEKFLAVRDQLPALRAIVLMEGDADVDGVHSWSTLLELAERVPESALQARIEAQAPGDLCTLIYTSGTTGDPKGVMLSHANLTWTAAALGRAMGVQPGDDSISYLPLSHIAEQILSMHGPMACGACVWCAESMEKLGENLRDVRPHLFLGVPRVWEKMQERMESVSASAPPWRRRLVRWARDIGLRAGYAAQGRGRRPLLTMVAERLVFARVRRALGLDRARVLATSAAPISLGTLEFFLSLGMPIYEVYGMSECTGPGTISYPGHYRSGAAGTPLAGTEVRLAADGEICMRGPHVFLGYFRDPDATAAAIDEEGWLHSGDIGEFDPDGFLRITDRKKELIITAGGENIAPQLVEGMLKSIPIVSQAVVVGDRERFLAALLTLDPLKLPDAAHASGCRDAELPAVVTDERFQLWMQRQVDEVNVRLAHVQQVKRFVILPHEFTVDGGELTPTMKLRRRVIHAKYGHLVQELFSHSDLRSGVQT